MNEAANPIPDVTPEAPSVKVSKKKIRRQLAVNRVQDYISGKKGKRLEFIYEKLNIISPERRCGRCLDPGASFVERMNLDPEYKRYLCEHCKIKLTS